MTTQKMSRTCVHGAALILTAMLGVGVLTGCADQEPVKDTSSAPAVGVEQTAPSSTELPEESFEQKKTSEISAAPDEPMSIETTVLRVIDGDTIAVEPIADVLEATNTENTEHSVRILSIDAPEMNYHSDDEPECGAEEATANLEKMLSPGEEITLEYDPEADRFDAYGRSLAYIKNADNEEVALQQVAAGYASAWYPKGENQPFNYRIYDSVGQQAETAGKGAWATCDTVGR